MAESSLKQILSPGTSVSNIVNTINAPGGISDYVKNYLNSKYKNNFGSSGIPFYQNMFFWIFCFLVVVAFFIYKKKQNKMAFGKKK